MKTVEFTKEEEKLIRKWRRKINYGFFGIPISESLFLAIHCENLYNKIIDENLNDLNLFYEVIVSLKLLYMHHYYSKELNLDKYLEFFIPRYDLVKDIIDRPFDIDTAACLEWGSAEEYYNILLNTNNSTSSKTNE